MMFMKNPLITELLLILVMYIIRAHTLTCHRAEYQIGDQCCPMCSAGTRVKTDCKEDRSTSCLPCTEGTFMNQLTGRKQCFLCTICAAGSGLKTKTSCTATTDALCEPLEGFYCLDSTGSSCTAAQKHSRCEPGQYISQQGTALSDTVCSDCSEGTYSDGTLTSCLPHTQCEDKNLQLVKPGSVSVDAECGEGSNKKNTVIAVGVGVGVGVVVVVVVVVLSIVLYTRSKKQRPPNSEGENNPEENIKFHKDELPEEDRHDV